jgi:hypothetical protein
MISCSALCTSGINSVQNVVAITPISITVLRLQWSDIAEDAKPPMHSMKVGPTASQRISGPVRCNGSLASTSNEPVSTKS